MQQKQHKHAILPHQKTLQQTQSADVWRKIKHIQWGLI